MNEVDLELEAFGVFHVHESEDEAVDHAHDNADAEDPDYLHLGLDHGLGVGVLEEPDHVVDEVDESEDDGEVEGDSEEDVDRDLGDRRELAVPLVFEQTDGDESGDDDEEGEDDEGGLAVGVLVLWGDGVGSEGDQDSDCDEDDPEVLERLSKGEGKYYCEEAVDCDFDEGRVDDRGGEDAQEEAGKG